MSYTKDSSKSFPIQSYRRYWIENFEADPGWTYNIGTMSVVRTRTGVSNPTWKAKIERGENATTGMTAIFQTIDIGSGKSRASDFGSDGKRFYYEKWLNPNLPTLTYWQMWGGDYDLINPNFTLTILGPTLSSSFVDNLARANFYKKLHSLTRKSQALVFLGELREALHMIRRPAFGLQNLINGYVDSLKKRKRAAPLNWKKNISDLWLEQSFGWQPLMQDIRQGVEAYQAITNRQQTQHVSAGARKMYDVSPATNKAGSVLQANRNKYTVLTNRLLERHTVRFKGAVRAQVEAPTWGDNMLLWGFSPLEFIPAAWELLPWSFLADYFANIGDLLDASVTDTSMVTYVNKTVLRESFRLFRWQNSVGPGPGAGWKFDSGHAPSPSYATTTHRDVLRSADVGVQMPSFQMNFNLSDGQLLNVAALLGSVNTSLYPQRQPRHWRR